MISIKRFLEQRLDPHMDRALLEASLQMARLLLDGIAAHAVRGREADWTDLNHKVKELVGRMEQPPTAFGLLSIGSDAVEALETYSQCTARLLREENEQMQSMVTMLTETVADRK